MVVEELFKTKWVEQRPFYSFLLGVFFTLVSFITSFLLFRNSPNFIGISTILFTVILVVPTINKLFDLEEKLEAKEKLSFFIKHEHIIDFFIYFFIGVFIVLFLIALAVPNMVFSEEQLYNIQNEFIEEKRLLPPPPPLGAGGDEIFNIFKNNFYVMIIAFILSLFYGAGALFLITLNASIFASTLAKVIKISLPADIGILPTFSFTICNLGIMLFHLVPEISGYLLAAIAGGVLSHAFIREKIGSKNFKNVLVDSVVLLVAAIIFLIIAAIVENEISKELFANSVCLNSQLFVILITVVIVIIVFVFEFIRKTKHTRKRYKEKKRKL